MKKKPGEQVFETSCDGNLLALQKRITAIANCISCSIVESEILGFIMNEFEVMKIFFLKGLLLLH